MYLFKNIFYCCYSSQKRKRSGGSRPARQRSRSASPKKASKSLAVEEISSSESGDEKNLSGNETDMSEWSWSDFKKKFVSLLLF